MTVPVAWSIAGSDSGASAGIQADIKTMNGLGVHCCTAITAITAQNTYSVKSIEPVTAGMLDQQLSALKEDYAPTAIKLGMLYSAELIAVAGRHLKANQAFVICDPVLAAGSGAKLLVDDAIKHLRSDIFPQTNLLTPNLDEAQQLLGEKRSAIDTLGESAADDYMEELADRLLKLGPTSVLIKGGHRNGKYSQDFWSDGKEKFWLTSPRLALEASTTSGTISSQDKLPMNRSGISRRTHGTGCTLAAAIAAAIALGYCLSDALVIGKMYVNQGLHLGHHNPGHNAASLIHGGWPQNEIYLPWLSKSAGAGRVRPQFQKHEQLGFYPIVDRVAWLKRLLPLGIKTIQLRIKDLQGDDLQSEIRQAVQIARQFDCSLYINDYWHLAIKYGATGVHLGQEDLASADIQAIEKAGLYLGISTHCYTEVASAIAFRPSYIAIGPIFATQTKAMRFAPQGITGLEHWRRLLSYPLVAIGGISLSKAEPLLAAGANGIAVVRDITNSTDVEASAQQWLKLCGNQTVALTGSLSGSCRHASMPPSML